MERLEGKALPALLPNIGVPRVHSDDHRPPNCQRNTRQKEEAMRTSPGPRTKRRKVLQSQSLQVRSKKKAAGRVLEN
jgi:hypothetical protein